MASPQDANGQGNSGSAVGLTMDPGHLQGTGTSNIVTREDAISPHGNSTHGGQQMRPAASQQAQRSSEVTEASQYSTVYPPTPVSLAHSEYVPSVSSTDGQSLFVTSDNGETRERLADSDHFHNGQAQWQTGSWMNSDVDAAAHGGASGSGSSSKP